jgi:hypothetical protein
MAQPSLKKALPETAPKKPGLMARLRAAVSIKTLLWRHSMAQNMVNRLYGQPMHISSYSKGTTVATVVLWYFEDGVRKFVMCRDDRPGSLARFVGCFDTISGQPVTDTLLRSVKQTLGDVFCRALDPALLKADRVASAPQLAFADPVTGRDIPVQGLCWALQITPAQAQLCAPLQRGLEIIAVPEYALMGPDVAPAHKAIYQSVLRHIHEHNAPAHTLTVDKLDEVLKRPVTNPRILH